MQGYIEEGPLVGNSSSDSNIKMTGFAFFKRFFSIQYQKGHFTQCPKNASDANWPNTSEILAVKWSIMKVINCKFEMKISDFFSKIGVSQYMVQMPALTFSLGLPFSRIV